MVDNMQIDNTEKMNNNSNPKPSRPCTEYNIFFQLERAYILQVELNDTTTLPPDEVFRTSQHSYAAHNLPNLPARYARLSLPYDWFLPGKEKRRKRKHRKSHGKISFQELSLKVAAAWKAVPDEVRIYCATVCSAGMDSYKSEMMLWRKRRGEDEPCEPAKKKRRTSKKKVPAKSQRRQSAKARKRKALEVSYSPDCSAPRDKDAMVAASQELPSADPPLRGSGLPGDGSFPEMCELFERDFGFDAEEETAFLDASPAVAPPETASATHPSVARALDKSKPNSYKKLRHRATLDMPDDEILQMWNTPARRGSVVLGFGMTNGQYHSGHMPYNVPSGADIPHSSGPAIPHSMQIQPQQPVRMDNAPTRKMSIEQKKVGIASIKKCSTRARAA